MFDVTNIPYFISIISNFLLAVFILLKGRKKKINQTFFATIIAANSWLISLFLYYNLELPKYILWIGRINFATVLPMVYFAFKFALIFPRDITSIFQKINTIIKIGFFILIVLTLFTPFVAKEEIIIGLGRRETVYGYLYPFYVITYFLFSFLIIILFLYKLKKFEKKIEKLQIKYVLLGLGLGLVFGFLTNILLPYFGFFDIANYGPFATLVFALFVAIAIVKHHLFEIKVILVQFLVVIIALILFVQALLTESILVRTLNWTVFILFCIFGYYLIKATLEEIKRREQIERISKDLEKAYKELKKIDESKSEFISIASHQLRTPLTAIKGYISMIHDRTYGIPPEKMEKPLRHIYISAERLIKLVSELLNISRIEAGKVKAEFEISSLEYIINSVITELKSLVKEKDLYLEFKKGKEPLPKISIDKEKMRQVILNVIDNAIRYTKEGGITVRCKKKENTYQVKVSDTGEGMTKREISDLFKSFSRGKAGKKGWVEGAGLGLYIAKKYVDMHKGKIWAKSQGKGKGSSFYIELPIQ